MAYLLTADIGGTTARFGLVPQGELRPQAVRIMYTADSPSLDVALHRFLSEAGATGQADLLGAVIAWAGHIGPGPLRLTNGPWVLDRAALGAALGIADVAVINKAASLLQTPLSLLAVVVTHDGVDVVVLTGGTSTAAQMLAAKPTIELATSLRHKLNPGPRHSDEVGRLLLVRRR